MTKYDRPKAILLGFPVVLTDGGGCTPAGPISGFFLDLLLPVFGFDGAVMPYDGSYLAALWHWLFADWMDG